MKPTDILPALLFLLLTVSCSMEADRLDANGHIEDAAVDKAALAFDLPAIRIATKATDRVEADSAMHATGNESAITSCSILLLNDKEDVVAVRDHIAIEKGKTTGNAFTIKKEKGLRAIVIANTTQTFSACRNLSAINDVIQQGDDLAKLVKMGSQQIEFSAAEMGQEALAKTVTVPVQQLAARIELAEFKVTDQSFTTTLPVDVILTEVTLLNIHTSCLTNITNNEDRVAGTTNSNPQTMQVKVYDKNTHQRIPLSEADIHPFYTFPGTENEAAIDPNTSKAVTMKLSFRVGDKHVTKYYKIQHIKGVVSVKSGYLYRLKINMTVTSNEIGFDVSCYTSDWKYQSIKVDMDEE